MKMYETVVLIDAKLDTENLDRELQKIVDFVKNGGGQNVTLKKWGRKELAYTMGGHDWAYYNSINFEGAGELAQSLTSWLRINDVVIKFETHRAAEQVIAGA